MGCTVPGLANCLDAEVKNFYNLQFSAVDALGQGSVTYVPLNISITDVNDNRPQMMVPYYYSDVIEGETILHPEMRVQVSVEIMSLESGQYRIQPVIGYMFLCACVCVCVCICVFKHEDCVHPNTHTYAHMLLNSC